MLGSNNYQSYDEMDSGNCATFDNNFGGRLL